MGQKEGKIKVILKTGNGDSQAKELIRIENKKDKAQVTQKQNVRGYLECKRLKLKRVGANN